MDSTKRPLRIPPEFATYAEKHGIFDLYKYFISCLRKNLLKGVLAMILSLSPIGCFHDLSLLSSLICSCNSRAFLEQLIIHKPTDPLAFLIEQLKRDDDDGN